MLTVAALKHYINNNINRSSTKTITETIMSTGAALKT